MKDRIRELGQMLNALNPFSTTVIKLDKGTKVKFEDLRMLDDVEIHFDERGQLIIPSGGSVKVSFKNKGGEFPLIIDDFKERTGHTPGAKITGVLKFNLDPDNPRQTIPGYGRFTYEKDSDKKNYFMNFSNLISNFLILGSIINLQYKAFLFFE